jgi:exopolyphosphatase/guanosine-5'-triphosphate,3'-diphosphate pyrophosphatase
VRNCLSDFRQELESLAVERTLTVATSAVRDAENGEAFLGEVEWSYGFTTRLLTGEEEALMTFEGATSGRALEHPTLVVDVGGGSTELVAGGPEGLEFHQSLDLGCVRLTERFLPSDPPSADELDSCARYVRAALADLPGQVLERIREAIGVAGTVTTLAALDLGLSEYEPERIHGHPIAPESVGGQLERLAALPLEERRRVPALEPERAPVIVAGAVIVREVLELFNLDALEASEHDLLHGAALEAACLPEPVEGDAPPGAYTCC